MRNRQQRFSTFYFLYYGASGFLLPYMATYFESRGLSGTEVGLALGLGSLISIFAQPLWSLLSDVYHLRRSALAFACLATAAFSFIFQAGQGFAWILTLSIGFYITRAPILPLGNALTFGYLERYGKREHYGPLRGWGSLGYALSSLLAGSFLGTLLPHVPAIHGGVLLVLAALVTRLPDTPSEVSGGWLEGLRLLPERPALVVFLLGVALVSAPVMTAVSYLAVFMEDLSAPGWLIGLTISSQAFLEIPFMQITPRLIARFRTQTLLMIGLALTPVRWLLLALIHDPVFVLPAQILHSTAIVSLLVIGASLMDEQLPPRWRATGQGLYLMVVMGLGPSLGLLAAGAIYERLGMRMVWTSFIFVALLGTLITAVGLQRLTKSTTADALAEA